MPQASDSVVAHNAGASTAAASVLQAACTKDWPVALTLTGSSFSRYWTIEMSCGAMLHITFSWRRITPRLQRVAEM